MNQFLRKARAILGLASTSGKDLPNIIMVLLDQFRNDARQTHEIFQELKRRGVLFSQMITYAPYTLASLHATFTGMYGRQNGVDAYSKSPYFDADHCYTLPQYLHDIGYYTRGYTFSPILIPHNGFDVLTVVSEEEETDVLRSHIQELEQCFSQKRNFFSYLHYGEIHHEVVKEVIRKYDNYSEEYFGNIEKNKIRYLQYTRMAGEYVDELLKTIDAFDENGNTLLIVLTDHGAGLGEKLGEKAYGVFTYDYSICVWLYLIWPRQLPVNREIACQIRSIDLLPTIIELLQISSPKRIKPIFGRSLLPLISGRETEDRVAFSETGGVEGPHPSPNDPNVYSIRDGKWKLIFHRSTNKFELFDIETDPRETSNLYTVYPDKASQLWKCMVDYL